MLHCLQQQVVDLDLPHNQHQDWRVVLEGFEHGGGENVVEEDWQEKGVHLEGVLRQDHCEEADYHYQLGSGHSDLENIA